MNTPRCELEESRQGEVKGEAGTRLKLLEAMLECCGEVGYRRVSVERVYRRYGGYRSQFYSHFRGKSDCYLMAYVFESGRLLEMLLSANGAGRRDRFPDALRRLAGYATEHPLKARGLFVEVHVAGGEALNRRQKVVERLARALDTDRRDRASRHAPPAITAEFMVGAVDQALSNALLSGRPEEFSESIPDLAALVDRAYAGGEGLG